jgi:DNA-damage-inducible protein D
MKKEPKKPALFEGKHIRRIWDDAKEAWYFSVVDIIAVLTGQQEHRRAQNYWTTFKNRLKEEGSEVITKCDQLKMKASDGKYYATDVADVETLLRLIQSIPSPKAEPFKLWLARVGYERIQETTDPEKSINRGRMNW